MIIFDGSFYWLLGVGVGILFVALLFLITKPKKKITPVYNLDGYLSALGSINNVLEVSARGSRLYLVLQNPQQVDIQALKDLGVSSVVTMSQKLVLLIGEEAVTIAQMMHDRLKT